MILNKKNILRLSVVLIIISIYFSGIAFGLFGTPFVITLQPENVTPTSATLRGSVNPNALDTQVFFASGDPSTSPSYFPVTPTQGIGSGTSYVDVSYDLSGLTPGSTYSYTVKASNGAGGSTGDIITFTTGISTPSAPQDFNAIAGDSFVTLNWNIPNNNGGSPVINYKIYRSTTSGGEILFKTVGNLLTYKDISITADQTYYYMVSAVNSAGEGEKSQEVSITTKSEPTPTPAPTQTPLLSISPDPFSINLGSIEAGESITKDLIISNAGGGTLTWRIHDDQSWITTTPSGINDNFGIVTVNINTAGLNPGSYHGTVTITSNDGTKDGSIFFEILQPSPPILIVSPDPFSFDIVIKELGESVFRIVTITNAGDGTLTWSVIDDSPWIDITPISGEDSGIITINIDTDGLNPGEYSGTITIISNGGTKKGSISLNVQPLISKSSDWIPTTEVIIKFIVVLTALITALAGIYKVFINRNNK